MSNNDSISTFHQLLAKTKPTSFAHSVSHPLSTLVLKSTQYVPVDVKDFEQAACQSKHRVFTLQELALDYNGKNGTPAYISAHGLVFDVSRSLVWRGSALFTLECGKDYSEYFTKYYSNDMNQITQSFPIVGRLIKN